jgi:tryptophan-rich sensory protein
MSEENLYAQLIKPEWAPPSWVFGPIWTVLYTIIAISYGAVFYAAVRGTLPLAVIYPFVLNLFFNLIFTPIQFGLKNNILASIDIILILVTILWMFYVIWPHAGFRWVIYANIPYLVWVSIATTLQLTITKLNI